MNTAPYLTAVISLLMLTVIVGAIICARTYQRLADAESALLASRDALASLTITEDVSVSASAPLPGWVEVKFDGAPVVMVRLRNEDGSQSKAGRRFMQVLARLAARSIRQG